MGIKVWLFQGLPKGDKMELIVQKAVELGVYGIGPFAAKRSVVRLDEKKAGKKQIRWQAIAKGAAEQSGRGLIPEVEIVKTYAEALEFAKELDVILVPYELEDGFTSKDFARVCRINKSTAGLALNILNYMGMVKRTGKQGNSYIYEVE